MATRRGPGLSFDHGAQYFKATTPEFERVVSDWLSSGAAAHWGNDAVGTPDMTAPAASLIAGLPAAFEQTVVRAMKADRFWSLSTAEPIADIAAAPFDAIVLAVPAPQAVAMLDASKLATWAEPLRAVRFAECWALMLATDGPIFGVGERQRPAHDAIAWIACNSAKPGRSPEPCCYVVHATPAWSRANLEQTKEDARDRLLAATAELSKSTIEPMFAAAHRWRYAVVEQPLGEPFIWDAESGIGVCGDWCLGQRVEAAFTSGNSLARRMMEGL